MNHKNDKRIIEITAYQAKMLWAACNLAQSQAVSFLMQYESGLFKESAELTNWYDEAVQEYQALREIKEQIGEEHAK